MWLRYAVLALYALYAIFIIVAWTSSVLPLGTTVQVCLLIHLAGVLFGVAAFGIPYVYPAKLGVFRRPIVIWDFIQTGAVTALTLDKRSWLAQTAAGIALVGIIGCFYKVQVLAKCYSVRRVSCCKWRVYNDTGGGRGTDECALRSASSNASSSGSSAWKASGVESVCMGDNAAATR